MFSAFDLALDKYSLLSPLNDSEIFTGYRKSDSRPPSLVTSWNDKSDHAKSEVFFISTLNLPFSFARWDVRPEFKLFNPRKGKNINMDLSNSCQLYHVTPLTDFTDVNIYISQLFDWNCSLEIEEMKNGTVISFVRNEPKNTVGIPRYIWAECFISWIYVYGMVDSVL